MASIGNRLTIIPWNWHNKIYNSLTKNIVSCDLNRLYESEFFSNIFISQFWAQNEKKKTGNGWSFVFNKKQGNGSFFCCCCCYFFFNQKTEEIIWYFLSSVARILKATGAVSIKIKLLPFKIKVTLTSWRCWLSLYCLHPHASIPN